MRLLFSWPPKVPRVSMPRSLLTLAMSRNLETRSPGSTTVRSPVGDSETGAGGSEAAVGTGVVVLLLGTLFFVFSLDDFLVGVLVTGDFLGLLVLGVSEMLVDDTEHEGGVVYHTLPTSSSAKKRKLAHNLGKAVEENRQNAR